MRYTKEQLIDLFVSEEIDLLNEKDVETVKGEFRSEIDRLGIGGSEKFEFVCVHDDNSIYDLGFKNKVAVYVFGYDIEMFWYNK